MNSRCLIANIAVVLLLIPLVCASAYAHSPHDDVFDVECSATVADDGRVFAIVRSVIFVSENGGESWRRLISGLDHKHMLVSLDVAAGGENLFVTSLGDGVFVSTDGGGNWRRANNGLDIRVLDVVAVSPVKSGHALVAGVRSDLYRTTNLGDEWSKIEGEFGKVTAIVYTNDEYGHVFLGDHRGGVYESKDDGKTWEEVGQFGDSGSITALDTMANEGALSTVVVGTASGQLFVATGNDPDEFSGIRVAKERQPVTSIALSPTFAKDGTVYVSVWDEGIYVSHDGGRKWTRLREGLTRDRQADQLGRPSFSKVCLSSDFVSDQTMFLAGFDGLFTSRDAGMSWKESVTISPQNVLALSISPGVDQNSYLGLTTYLWGVYLSNDAGESWKPIYDGLLEPRDAGITRLFSMEFSPNFNKDRTLFTSTWYRFYTSRDGGSSWDALPEIPLPEDAPRHHGSYIAVSPAFAEDGTIFAGTMPGVLVRSTDGGERYKVIANLQRLIGSVVLSPAYRRDRTLFVGDTRGVHRSRDGGDNWEFTPLIDDAMYFEMPISPGYYEAEASAWEEHVLTQRDKEYGIRLAVSPAFASDASVFAGTPDGLMRSTNGGESWERLGQGALDPRAFIESVAVSPDYEHDRTILVSVRGEGLLESRDGGETFSHLGADLMAGNQLLAHYPSMTPKFPTIVFSPTYASDRTVYGFAGPELLRSVDSGDSWQKVHTPSPSLTARLYAWWHAEFQPWVHKDHIPGLSALHLLLLLAFAVVAVAGALIWARHRKVVSSADI